MAHILLVEPNRMLAKQYWEALADAGHEVTICLTGQEAIFAADERRPELVILELQLKGHNGVEFLYELRSYPEWQNIPVIIQSFVPEAEISSARTLPMLGIKDYLYKPVSSLKKLIDAVESISLTTPA